MNPTDSKWPRLAAAARSAADPRDPTAPYGFATRVAALAAASPRAVTSLLERLSWRALGVAGLLALTSTVANYPLFTTALSVEEEALVNDGAVAALFDFSS